MQRAILGTSVPADIAITNANPWTTTIPVARGTYLIRVAGIINVTSSGGSLRTVFASTVASAMHQAQTAVVGSSATPTARAASSATSCSISATVYSTTGNLPFTVEATVVAERTGTFTFTLDVTSGAATLPAGISLGAWRIGT